MRRVCVIVAHFDFIPTIGFFCSRTALRLFQSSCAKNTHKKEPFVTFNNGCFSPSPLFSDGPARLGKCRVELMDSDTWRVSSDLADVWRGNVERGSKTKAFPGNEEEDVEEMAKYAPPNTEDPGFDEIEEMRIRGNLFYKLDKDSKEYEEHKFDFHGRNRNKGDKKESARNMEKVCSAPSRNERTTECRKKWQENRKGKENKKQEQSLELTRTPQSEKKSHLIPRLHDLEGSGDAKTKRTLTFNQITAPYHMPFCLDIYLSKGSVRASIIHRPSSKVVAVAHSISKDMKFDLKSTKNRATCSAVGEVLAQRALADDIHNVVYTPRKGERLDGKLQIVLQAIIDGGIDVKVKLKQRKPKRSRLLPPKA
ncbi:unnamed protein product [Cuscuta epithymum]|uniref:Uncharacterized protein n=1 Tax=Cuscuta epithymum TaxID=186058 RepID=A0AAV0FN43_9ASTE|nr:unnamed protein product [Cuscuta epithymum]